MLMGTQPIVVPCQYDRGHVTVQQLTFLVDVGSELGADQAPAKLVV